MKLLSYIVAAGMVSGLVFVPVSAVDAQESLGIPEEGIVNPEAQEPPPEFGEFVDPLYSSCIVLQDPIEPAVSVHVRHEPQNAIPGINNTVVAVVTNNTDVDINDASLYIRVYQQNAIVVAGEPQVDAFVVPEKINVPARSTATTTFVWKIPVRVGEGVLYFEGSVIPHQSAFVRNPIQNQLTWPLVVVGNQNDIGGLYFEQNLQQPNNQIEGSEDGVGGDLDFLVNNIHPGYITFRGAGRVDIPVEATIVNSTKIPVKGEVIWRVYALQDPHVPVAEWESPLGIHPGSSTTVMTSVAFTAASGAGYYLEGRIVEEKQEGTQAMVGMLLLPDNGCDELSDVMNTPTLPQDDPTKTIKIIGLIGLVVIVLGVGIYVLLRRSQRIDDMPMTPPA